MLLPQFTLQKSISITGIGVHSGESVTTTLHPAAAYSGISFVRNGTEIPATIQYLKETKLSSALAKNEVTVATIEHLMAALNARGIDNITIELSAAEVPILDGSAKLWLELLDSAGIKVLSEPRQGLRILSPVKITSGDSWIEATPFDGLKLHTVIDFTEPFFKQHPSSATIDFAAQNFAKLLCDARTFGLLSDYDYLRAHHLALGSSLENTVVIDGEKVVNAEGLRHADECVKHKMLDQLGDLYLLGHNLIGQVSAYKPGHTLNHQLVTELLATPTAFRLEPLEITQNCYSWLRPYACGKPI